MIDWFIMPVAGALIGYGTNWIAIKMLFRPLREKRLFGRRVPFTPGLISKEKPRLARSIGNSFASNVLTEGELTKAVTSPAVMDKFTALLDRTLTDLKLGKFDGKIEEFCEEAARRLIAALNDASSPINSALSSLGERIKDAGLLNRLLESLRENNNLLSDYAPDFFAERAMAWFAAKIPVFAGSLKDLPEKYPDIDEAINKLVKKIAEDNLGPFLGMFVKTDQIYEKFKTSAFNWLLDPANTQFLAYKISAFADTQLRKEVGEIINQIPEDTLDGIINKINEKAGEFSLSGLLHRIVPNPEKTFKSILSNILHALTDGLNDENSGKFRNFLLNALQALAAKGGSFIVSAIKFDELIENKINASTPEDTEKMVTSVVSRELRMITALGGILGFFIGFTPLIIQSITG
ncbi:MAG: DUF445 family protein [Defluviitaleaceae bacterium]|nr:DUF445 family protein [Defluviitaleaceae bacterium]